MAFHEHGGYCCGISHVCNFPAQANAAWLDREMAEAVEEIEERNEGDVEEGLRTRWRGAFGHAIEVVLTDDQMKVWAPTLKTKGFKFGFRWLNDNSGNYCNLLIWAPKKPSKHRPYKW